MPRGFGRPTRHDFVGARVNCHNFVFVRIIVEDHALAINGWELDCPTKIDVRNNSLLDRINDGGILTVAVESKDVLSHRFVDDRVRIRLVGRYLPGDF